ncbi:Fc.00g099580.m01.CDS01 [Cosmosporella sp. VM-42]
MDEIYQKINRFNPRTLNHSEDGDVVQFEATELWRDHSTGSITASNITVRINELSKWLDEETRGQNGVTESLVLRFVWTELHDMVRVGLSKSVVNKIAARFGLELAYGYFQTALSGLNAFPKIQTPISENQAYSFCFAPNLAAIWSHNHFRPPMARKSVTYGLVLSKELPKEPSKKTKTLQKLLSSGWNPTLLGHSMFPALLFSLMLGGESALTVNGMTTRVQEVEERTGHQKFKTKRKSRASGVLGDLSAEMSGYATRLASVERKSKTLEKLLDFIFQQVGEYKEGENQHTAVLGGMVDGDDLVRHHAGALRQRLNMQVLETNYILKRVQVQIEALVNLIAQNDAINNFDIALSSHRDAASMKTLAVVTMFFLPGSFISALFSTQCFDWDSVDLTNRSISVKVTPQFGLYWVITIPLTVATFILYFLWLHFQTQQRKKLPEHMQKLNGRASTLPPDEESHAIAMRRKTMGLFPDNNGDNGDYDDYDDSDKQGIFSIPLQRLRQRLHRVTV